MEKPFTSTPTPLDLSSLGPHESKLGKFHNLKKHTPIPRIDETHPVRFGFGFDQLPFLGEIFHQPNFPKPPSNHHPTTIQPPSNHHPTIEPSSNPREAPPPHLSADRPSNHSAARVAPPPAPATPTPWPGMPWGKSRHPRVSFLGGKQMGKHIEMPGISKKKLEMKMGVKIGNGNIGMAV